MNPVTARKRILVVDDEQDMRFMLAERLTNWGYAVSVADDATEAWRIAKEELPALILLDIMMPQMKGRDFCELLKANPRTKDIPVIFLTALGLPDHIKAGLEVGGEDYITKPFDPEDLKDRIRVCVARHHNLQGALQEEPNDDPNRGGRRDGHGPSEQDLDH